MAAGLLDKERIVAGPGFNRWLVPPAALAMQTSARIALRIVPVWFFMTDSTVI